MSTKVTKIPKWMDRSLQGITYWIGHRRALYSGYALGEAALVAELCNMIYTHLDRDQVLRCEVRFEELLNKEATETGILTSRARADIVVSRKLEGRRRDPQPGFVVEVKRASASNAQIDHDLRRLAAVKACHPDLAAFLVVIAEAERPRRFVDEEGAARATVFRVPDTDHLYKVRRVSKATHSFKRMDRAQYACLLEVSPAMDAKRLRSAKVWTSAAS